ncbi:MAG TPA: SDR family oxidoreductase [Ilumatobacteraceae bacterium]|jgi:NAD(P)-dependent dehydrogenase (short-subunit alcohol dehydrogenase family)
MGADVTNPTGVAGRSVIVTGAGRGLGLDYARMYATEGARVALVDIQGDLVKNAVEMLSADLPDAEIIGLEVDVTDRRSTAAMGEEVISSFGTIEILVNNAGIWGDLQPAQLIATDPDYWDLVMNVNLRGALLCAQAVIAPMRKQRWGRIINISSMGAYMPSGVYGVSKLGLNQLTYTLSTEVGVDGITVNAVAPGPIDNEATRSQLPEKAMQKMIDGTAMKRMGTSSDLFGMLRYLSSTDADWVTGQTFLVNGGYNSRM